MADPAQTQEKGSGEGSSEVKPTETASVESKPVEEVKIVESPKTDNVQPEQAENKPDTAQIATQTSVIDGDVKPEGTQTKAPEANSNVQETPSVVDAIEKKEEAIKETVLIAELNVPKVDDQPKDALTVPATEAKDNPTVPATEVKDTAVVPTEVKTEELKPEESTSTTEDGDWQNREQELLKKIEELEKFKKEKSEDGLKLELKVREEEIDLLKARVKNLETELQAALSKPGKNHEMMEKIKQQHEELLSKARGMIFDKTKMVKNQELQIEALTTQVQSLKDINLITKDLLEIRNSEVKAMEDRLQVMEARFKAEKERYDLVLKRAQTSTNINDDLRREYETQLALFKELREKYELRVQALVAENNRLKESNGGTSG